jgi:F0F1-type ATP synthase membrane subunit b/b'
MDLTVDSSIVLQIITFLVLWACLKQLVFDPFAEVITARQTRTTGTVAAATALSADAAQARTHYDAALVGGRTELAQEADVARKATQEESERALAAAREEAAATIARQRAAVAQQTDAARQSLLAQATAVAEEMLARASGRTSA